MIKVNNRTVGFLNLTLNMHTGQFEPFMKLNSKIMYVNKSNNHPLAMIKNIPKNINKRLSKILKQSNI